MVGKYSNEFTSSSNKDFEKKIATLEAKLTHKNEILVELMEVYIPIKNVWGPITGYWGCLSVRDQILNFITHWPPKNDFCFGVTFQKVNITNG